MTLYKPIHHTQQIVGGIEYEMSWILSTTNDITTECKKHVLSRRSKRILFRMRNKNELIWEKFYKKFLELKTANEELLFIEHTDVLAQEMPYTKNFSVILHHFQRYSFQRN